MANKKKCKTLITNKYTPKYQNGYFSPFTLTKKKLSLIILISINEDEGNRFILLHKLDLTGQFVSIY